MWAALHSPYGRWEALNLKVRIWNSKEKLLLKVFSCHLVEALNIFLSFLSLGHSLTQFVRHCADHFLNSEHKEIRMEAARTCSRLLTPSIHLISGHVVSQTAVQVVADVLSKLLVVGITDPGKTFIKKW